MFHRGSQRRNGSGSFAFDTDEQQVDRYRSSSASGKSAVFCCIAAPGKSVQEGVDKKVALRIFKITELAETEPPQYSALRLSRNEAVSQFILMPLES
jgi:hypothetical protein